MKLLLSILITTGFSSIAFAQNAGLRYAGALENKAIFTFEISFLLIVPHASLDPTINFLNKKKSDFEVKEMPMAFCVKELPLFCKWEYKMEKAATFPVKFRLGDVLEVDQMEGK